MKRTHEQSEARSGQRGSLTWLRGLERFAPPEGRGAHAALRHDKEQRKRLVELLAVLWLQGMSGSTI